ncbi:hypothetical protein RRG08_039993 [Elysia crispata]|uniref:Uncharacterized protein n=1 Tax=Elysia crispata TaxID=231223 RepID=A0AAE0Z9J2_9GAST|nr:hypothetical protein RRG08_039993 [Elysia crispata]
MLSNSPSRSLSDTRLESKKGHFRTGDSNSAVCDSSYSHGETTVSSQVAVTVLSVTEATVTVRLESPPGDSNSDVCDSSYSHGETTVTSQVAVTVLSVTEATVTVRLESSLR